MSLVNYLGTYETLDQVWETYPEGGKEGDYLYIASVLKKWNKYTSAWVDATQEDVEGSTIMSLEEDVVVGSSTLINYLGRFETLENALNAFPEGGNEGDYVYVGNDIYAWDKYAYGWFISSDVPLEMAISEEDIIPNSNTFINYLGGFVDRDAVWHKYPEGGKVGDYLYIASDLHIWDKYICNWVAATPPDESSQIRPIEHLAQEGVVEYSENYINYLGVFESIEQAWETYPEGGKEGDYIIVGGEQLRWNKYTNNWGEYDPDASTPARPVATIYGDLHVHNDVIIGEDLYARILETFTTKKWVLEQGYISMDDVTSELVMSKIVPDNTTIAVRNGKLVVIGGGSGGGTADSVEWDNITGKPSWIGDTKPTYTLDEIAGSNGDGFVTLLSDQTIEGVKNFAKGIQFEGLPMYRSKDDTVYLDANLVVRGGVTMYGSNLTTSPSIFEALPIDNDTIKRNAKGELYAVGGGGSGTGGGGVADSVAWSNVTNKPTWITDTKPKYSYSEILDTPDLSVYAIKSSVDNALSNKADKATTLAGYGITNAYTKSEINNIIDSLDDTYVTIAGEEQSITAEHNFVNGFKVGGLPIKKSQDNTIYLDANLVVSGAITMYGSGSTTFPTIWANIPFNLEHMSWDGSQWSVVGGGVADSVAWSNITGKPTWIGANKPSYKYSEIGETPDLSKYATQSWVTSNGYITSDALEPYALKTAIPTSLKNPNALVWSGYSTGSYDGSTAQSITIPNNTNQLTNGAGFITASASITGSAATSNGLIEEVVTDLNNATAGRIFTMTSGYGSTDGNKPTTGWATGLTLQYAQNGVYRRQLAYSDVDLYIREEHNGVWEKWRKILTSTNFYDYALPITGGTVTGNVRINKFLAVGAASSSTNTARAQIHLVSSGANPCDLYFGADDTLYWSVTARNAADAGGFNKAFALYDVTNSAYRMMIFPSGNLAIGGTTASEKLHVYGNIKTTGDFDGGAYFLRSSNAANPLLRLAVGSQYYYVQAMSDAIYVGATSATSLKVTPTGDTTVRGNLLATGAVTMYYSSDKRLKQNIRKVNASKMLMSLGGVYQYEYIDSEVEKNHIYGGSHFGLIYQNVKGTALKSMCHEREDGYGSLNYLDTNFISLIAGATMENITEVEKLNRKIRTLEAKVKQLEQRA